MTNWIELAEATKHITLTASNIYAPAFDDDPDQSAVPLPIVKIEGVEGWSYISVPESLHRVVASSVESAQEVVRLRGELEKLREVFNDAAMILGDIKIPVNVQQARGFCSDITRILEGESND